MRYVLLLMVGMMLGDMTPLAAQTSRPNIVIILADDQGFNDIGYHGSPIRTPTLDRLAAEGVHFRRYYAYATCSPTRVALLTGRNPARYGAFGPLRHTTRMQASDTHLLNALRQVGYTTHISGKWHIGSDPEHRPLQKGFDTSYGYLGGQIDPYTHRGATGAETWHRNDEFIEEAGHVTRLITDEAVRVIREAKDGDKPFFLYVAHHAPHYPLNEPPQYIEPYKEVFDDIWRQHYAASITHMDEQIGRIVDALDETGQRGNTLIIYASDNGGQNAWHAPPQAYNGRYAYHRTLGDNAPLRGYKHGLYEGGIRVPALVNWPGVIPAGGVVEPPTHVLDWAATLITLTGGEIDPAWDLHGLDIWPLILGKRHRLDDGPTARFYWNNANRMHVMRQGNWKLVRSEDGGVELFHLDDDPGETRDRAADQPDLVRQLQSLLDEQRRLDG